MATPTKIDPINIGFPDAKKKPIADGLRKLHASTFALYIKAYSFHWNIEGDLFMALHALFQEQYEELADAVDMIAERIRAMGYKAPGSMKEFQQLSVVKDCVEVPRALDMVAELAKDQQAITLLCHELVVKCNEVNDLPNIDLLTQRMAAAEKFAWKLRATMVK